MIRRKSALLLALSAAVAVLFCSPGLMVAFTTIGGSLSTSSSNYQRDVRVFNNFQDAVANNNPNIDDDYPGAMGADLAVWKAAVAWGSTVSGKNFDFDWQGSASSVGSRDNNTVSSLTSGCGGSTLAFMEGPISNGWRIRFCENRLWDDGPGAPAGFDLQGVATHELGHALGLGHSNNSCTGGCANRATMCASVCSTGVEERAPKTDDRNGLEFIYGTIPSNKPVITGISGTFQTGSTLVINGMNFRSTVNVKFTAGTSQNSGGIPGVVFNVPSTNGGTRVQVTIPSAAQSGNVFIWQPGNGGLSNYFPIYINENPPAISSVFPTEMPVRGGAPITILGSNFFPTAQVDVGATMATLISRSETEIVVEAPPGNFVGELVDVVVRQGTGTAVLTDGLLYTENPVRLEWSGVPEVGSRVTISVFGPVNRDVAVAIGHPGSTERIGIDFCVVGPFPFVRKFSAGLNTGAAGRGDTVWEGVTGVPFETLHIVGVVKLGPGTFADLGCNPMTIFP